MAAPVRAPGGSLGGARLDDPGDPPMDLSDMGPELDERPAVVAPDRSGGCLLDRVGQRRRITRHKLEVRADRPLPHRSHRP